MSNEPRKATVTAVDDVICLKLDVANFNNLLGNIEQVQQEDAGMTVLKKIQLLSGLNDKQLKTIARSLTKQSYPVGAKIVTQGDPGEEFFIIFSGQVSVTVNHVEVAKLNSGQYFGETSLLNQDKRNATVSACGSLEDPSSDTVCLLLSRADVSYMCIMT